MTKTMVEDAQTYEVFFKPIISYGYEISLVPIEVFRNKQAIRVGINCNIDANKDVLSNNKQPCIDENNIKKYMTISEIDAFLECVYKSVNVGVLRAFPWPPTSIEAFISAKLIIEIATFSVYTLTQLSFGMAYEILVEDISYSLLDNQCVNLNLISELCCRFRPEEGHIEM